MKPSVYWSLFRPAHAVLYTALYAFGISRFMFLFEHGGSHSATWVAVVALAPYTWGTYIALAANAAMYRPFFPLLPDGLARLRRATAWMFGGSAAVFASAAVLFERVPVMGAIGFAGLMLAIALMIPPLAVRPAKSKAVAIRPPVSVLILIFGSGLPRWIERWPELFLVVGLGATGWAFRRAFSPRLVVVRASTVLSPAAWGLMVFGDRSAVLRHAQEAVQFQSQTAEPARQLERRRGGPFVHRPARTTWDWMRLNWASLTMQFRFPRTHVIVAVIFAAEAAVLPAVMLFFPGAHHGNFWVYVAALVSRTTRDPAAMQIDLSVFGLGVQSVFMVSMAAVWSVRAGMFPLSRPELARLAFRVALVQMLVSVATFISAFLVIGFAGYCLAYHTAVGFDAWGLAALLVLIAPLLPIAALLRTLRSRVILALVTMAAFACGVARPSWSGVVLTPWFVVLAAGLTAGSLWVLSRGLRRHYRRCDLVHEFRASSPVHPAPLAS